VSDSATDTSLPVRFFFSLAYQVMLLKGLSKWVFHGCPLDLYLFKKLTNKYIKNYRSEKGLKQAGVVHEIKSLHDIK